MIIPRKACIAVLMAAVAATRYKASYPFWSAWKDPVLNTGLETVVNVSLTAMDADGAVSMDWFLKDPLVPLKAAVKRDAGAMLRISAECDGTEMVGTAAHRDFTMAFLAEHHERMGDIVDAVAHTALYEAYKEHPAASRFMAEAAGHFRWEPGLIMETISWLDGMSETPEPVEVPDPGDGESETRELVAA